MTCYGPDCNDDDDDNIDMHWCNGYGFMLLLVLFAYILQVYYGIVKPLFGAIIHKAILQPLNDQKKQLMSHRYKIWTEPKTKFKCLFHDELHFYFRFSALGLSLFAFIIILTFIIYDTTGSRHRLQSLVGILVMMTFGFVFSKHPTKVFYATN